MHRYMRIVGTTVIIWVTHDMPEDVVQDYCDHYQATGYQVVLYRSGGGDILPLTQMLMRYNVGS